MRKYNHAFYMTFCLIFLCSAGSGNAEDQLINLRYSHFMAQDAREAILAKLWCDEVNERTKGKVKVEFFPGSVLSPARQAYDNVVKGSIDVALYPLGLAPDKFPLTMFIELPLGYKNSSVASKLINEYYKKFMPKEFDDVKVLYLYVRPPNLLSTTRPINSLKDIRNMKIRVIKGSLDIISALDGFPSSVPFPEIARFLQMGDIDGILMNWVGILESNLTGLIRYTVDNYESTYGFSFVVLMNKNKWNSLTQEIQDIIERLNDQWIEVTARDLDISNQEAQAECLSRGVKFISLSSEEKKRWKDRMKPLFEKYVNDVNAKNLPGEEVLRFAVDYLSVN